VPALVQTIPMADPSSDNTGDPDMPARMPPFASDIHSEPPECCTVHLSHQLSSDSIHARPCLGVRDCGVHAIQQPTGSHAGSGANFKQPTAGFHSRHHPQQSAYRRPAAETPSTIFELGGPRVYSYEEFLRAVAHQAGLAPRLIPIPFAVWNACAWASEMFPSPLLTRNQVELMQIDTVSSPEMSGFVELGISPHSVEAILQKMLSNCG
jgi:hypothetical protein